MTLRTLEDSHQDSPALCMCLTTSVHVCTLAAVRVRLVRVRALVMLEGVLCPMSSMSSPSLVRFSDRVSVVDPVVVAVGDDCADNESLPPTNNRLAAWVLKVT